ncbi:hypothetical protein C4901_01840 [Acidiferrobacter sp. SPIII_3]|jgi:hypothetical protein|uniref:hypothetical protein n=1 Tax=Acidiferrobacter sp. SPIII_3 TaxID=1281578 RepID=UPI000D73444D|nr:hypothetical protein [Acidiferrobacter sp. SPIII_3]AWP22248.1 hypothetical protein C4901_01840 [Acidiferrobacter sp. SPIII_3]
MKKARAVLLLWVLGVTPAGAFLGVGDVTFDPPVHAELMTLFHQTIAIYRTVLSEVHRLQAVESTLRGAQRDAKSIANGNLARYAQRRLPRGLPHGLRRLLGTTDAAAHEARDAMAYAHQQSRRFGSLARLHWLGRGVRQDLRLSATNLGARTSNDVTARSTATLATLAAKRARARERQAIRRAAERHNARHLPEEAASLYRAFGETP